jgi:RNA polymerase sigma-70 factor (ECF subfamily)
MYYVKSNEQVFFDCLVKKRRFEKLLEEHLDSLLQLAYMRCRNKELAEDLVQDTCAKAYEAYITKDNIENPKAWIFKILINTHIDYTRKKQLNIVEVENFDFVDKKTPEMEMESNVFFKDLNDCLNKLDKDQRTVIYLSDINEYSYKEIAELLGVPLGTVMSRLHRARQSLRSFLLEKGYSRSKNLIPGGDKS